MDKTRQLEIINAEHTSRYDVTMIGTGGIGAATALALAKLGIPRFYLYDDDSIEDLNIPTQLLKISDIGKDKAVSVGHMLKEFSDEVSGTATVARVVSETILPGSKIVISSVDSISSRKAIWEAVIANRGKWYLDARMGAEVFQLYTVDTAQPDWYVEHLSTLDEANVPEEPCTAKATIYTAFIAAGHIAHQVKRIIMGQKLDKFIVHDIANFTLIRPGGQP